MKSRLIINAVNIHMGGGLKLLHDLLNSDGARRIKELRTDVRSGITALPDVEVISVKPNIISRFASEMSLYSNTQDNDLVLFMGNLPPLRKLGGQSVVFLQNRYLIDTLSTKQFPMKHRLRLLAERIWFRLFCRNADAYIVQTRSMRELLNRLSGFDIPVHVIPFANTDDIVSGEPEQSDVNQAEPPVFFYPASGETHKNHETLVLAWIVLAEQGHFPKLVLTLDDASYKRISDRCRTAELAWSMNITNLGPLSRDAMNAQYHASDALIFPSLAESFGLPLIEAKQLNLPIIASEADYVRDSVDPNQTFDPHSALSIARAVKRHCGFEETRSATVDGQTLLERIKLLTATE